MSKFLSIAANPTGCDFIVGDIHGMYSLLQEKLDEVCFDPRTDRLFALGDLIDRGEESHHVIEWLDKPWFYSIMGNHEQLACKALDMADERSQVDWMMNGGAWFFNKDICKISEKTLLQRLRELPLAIELELADGRKIGLVHAETFSSEWADVVKRTELVDKNEYVLDAPDLAALLWSRKYLKNYHEMRVSGVSMVVLGHNIIDEPILLGNRYYIDTGAFNSKVLTCIEPVQTLRTLRLD